MESSESNPRPDAAVPTNALLANQVVQIDPRVAMAAERTLLAWIRTGLAMMGFGFVLARFGLFLQEIAVANRLTPARTTGISLWMGTGLVVFGVAVNALAALSHIATIQRLQEGQTYRVKRWSMGVITASLLAVLGLAVTAYLLTVG